MYSLCMCIQKTIREHLCTYVFHTTDTGNWKQWKWKPEMENGNGNRNSQNLMQMDAGVKPLINDHLLKTTSLQRPHKIISQRLQMAEISCYRDCLYVKITFQQIPILPMRACFLRVSAWRKFYRWSDVK